MDAKLPASTATVLHTATTCTHFLHTPTLHTTMPATYRSVPTYTRCRTFYHHTAPFCTVPIVLFILFTVGFCHHHHLYLLPVLPPLPPFPGLQPTCHYLFPPIPTTHTCSPFLLFTFLSGVGSTHLPVYRFCFYHHFPSTFLPNFSVSTCLFLPFPHHEFSGSTTYLPTTVPPTRQDMLQCAPATARTHHCHHHPWFCVPRAPSAIYTSAFISVPCLTCRTPLLPRCWTTYCTPHRTIRVSPPHQGISTAWALRFTVLTF